MNVFKKTLLASAVSMALAGGAQAGSVSFDFNGGLAGGGPTFISGFDWSTGNLLMLDMTPAGANPVAVVGQAVISSIKISGGGTLALGTNQFTYQMRTYLDNDGTFGFTAATAPGTTFFDIFWNNTGLANDVTGCGFGTNQSAFCEAAMAGGSYTAAGGKRIFTGTALAQADTLTGLLQGGAAGDLDQTGDGNDVANSQGITTRKLTLGSFVMDVNTISYDPAFFLSNITSMPTDIIHTETGGGAPFALGNANPSDEVVGTVTKRTAGDKLAFFGNGVNDIAGGSCGSPQGAGGAGGADSLCGIQLSNHASSGVNDNAIPEPGTVALLGLGLVGFGAITRRRRRTS